MSTWRHLFRQRNSWLLLFFVWNLAIITNGQLALKTLPLTSPRNRSSSGLGIYAKWPSSLSSLNNRSPSIENELAAIFRGVAYGITTETPPTTIATTTTTSTTSVATPTEVYLIDDQNISEGKDRWQGESDARPVLKSPKSDSDDDIEDNNNIDFLDSSTEESILKVVKADIGISDVAWVSSFGVPWQIHVYVIAGLFSLLAILSLYCLARVHVTPQLLPKGYYITVHLLVFLAAFFRCIFFFHDPYAISHRLPAGLANLLLNTGTPCIITALAVLVLGLLRAARLKLLPLNLQSPIAVAIISGVLVVGSVMVDILEGVIPEQQLASGLRAGIQALTAGWGSALCIGFIVIFSKVDKAAHRQQIEVLRLSFSRIHLEGSTLPQHLSKSSLNHAARATLIACITGLLLAILQVYGLMNSDGITNIPPRYPWIWFAYQSSCRFLELLLWTSVCIASALPANYAKKQRHQTGSEDNRLLTVFSCNGYCTSCSNLSSCCYSDQKMSDDMYSTICHSNHVARNYGQDEKCIIPQETIATTRMHPKNISTTLLPPLKKVSQRNTHTLHSGNSDVHLLWNSTKSNSNSSNSSSRPSSLILTEGGLIKFRTHDLKSNNFKVFSFPKHELSATTHDVRNKIMQGCNGSGEDNYINSGALTPEEKRILENSIRSGNVPMVPENKFHQSVCFPQPLQKNNSFLSEGDIKGKYYGFTSNNYDLHVYEDGDQVCYQCPSMDSSTGSNGHLYASVLQSPYQRRHIIPLTPQRSEKQEKILNNSSSFLGSPLAHRISATSSHQDMVQVDYLTDASQEYMSPQNEMPIKQFSGSIHSPFHDKSLSCSSPSHAFNCHLANSITNKNELVYNNYMIPEGAINLEENCDANESFLNSSQGRGSLFNKIVSTQGGVVYSPLRTDDICFSLSSDKGSNVVDDHIRIASHRPRHVQLSPSPMHGQNVFLSSPQSSPRHTGPQLSSRVDVDCQKQNQLSPHKDKTKQKQGKLNYSDDSLHDSFGVQQLHAFQSERLGSNYSEENKDLSFNSSETTSINGSNTDLQSECVDTDGSENLSRDTNDFRWSPNYQKDKN